MCACALNTAQDLDFRADAIMHRHSARGSRISLGLQGRLRGGFGATPLPGTSSNTPARPQAQREISPSPSMSESESFTNHNGSILNMLISIQASNARLETQQKKLENAFQELKSLLQKQEKGSFSTKGTPFEVNNNYYIIIVITTNCISQIIIQ